MLFPHSTRGNPSKIAMRLGRGGANRDTADTACHSAATCYYFLSLTLWNRICMARICELTGKGPMKGSIIWRSGKSKKSGGIGTHITAITKRRFFPNLQRVKAVVDGEVRYIRVTANAIKQGLVVKAPKRTWKKDAAATAKA
jgi:large subunit ribosomal protein L28